jgi:hypothetical protein
MGELSMISSTHKNYKKLGDTSILESGRKKQTFKTCSKMENTIKVDPTDIG